MRYVIHINSINPLDDGSFAVSFVGKFTNESTAKLLRKADNNELKLEVELFD